MPVVRKASFDDAREIAEINATVWQTAYQNLLPAEILNTRKADEKRIDDWQRRTDNGKYTILVYDDGEVSGYLWAGPARDDMESFMKFMHFMSKATDSGRESDGRCLRLTRNRLIMLHIIYICLKATFPPRDFTKAWAAKIFPNITAAKNIRDMTFPKSFMFLPGNYKYFFRKSALKCFSYIRRRSA